MIPFLTYEDVAREIFLSAEDGASKVGFLFLPHRIEQDAAPIALHFIRNEARLRAPIVRCGNTTSSTDLRRVLHLVRTTDIDRCVGLKADVVWWSTFAFPEQYQRWLCIFDRPGTVIHGYAEIGSDAARDARLEQERRPTA